MNPEDSNEVLTDESLDFDGEILGDDENSEPKFQLLDGQYTFTVNDVFRGRFPGGPKLGPCNKVTLYLDVDGPDGIQFVKTDLLLHKALEWKIASFFRSIGMKKKGEKLQMDWSKTLGKRGIAEFKPRSYEYEGETRQANDLKRFIDPPAWVRDAEEAAEVTLPF